MFFSWWCLVLVVIYGVSGADVAHEYGGVDNGDAEAESYGGRSLGEYGAQEWDSQSQARAMSARNTALKEPSLGFFWFFSLIFSAISIAFRIARWSARCRCSRRRRAAVGPSEIEQKIETSKMLLAKLEHELNTAPHQRYLDYN